MVASLDRADDPVGGGRRAYVTSPDAAAPASTLGQKAARGGLIQILGYVVGRLPVLGATFLIARILAPEEFGTVALALVVVSFLESIHDFGVGQAIVYLPDDRRVSDAALAIAALGSSILVALAWVAAPTGASLFDNAEAEPLIRVLSLTLILGAVAQIPDGVLRKRLLFGRRTIAILFRSIGRAACSVALVLLGFGAWSIAWGYVLGDLVYFVAIWILTPYRPARRNFSVDSGAVREVLSFGAPVALAVMLTGLIFTIDAMIVGVALGTEAVGLYTLAQRIPDAGITRVFFVVSGVAFPIFRAARNSPGRLEAGYLSALRLQVGFVLCAAATVSALAPSLVPLVLGDEWLSAVLPLQLLAFHAAGMSLATGTADVFKAIGRPRVPLWATVAQLVVLVPALIVASRYGLDAIAGVAAGAAFVFAVVLHGLVGRVLEIRPMAAWHAIRPPVLSAGAIFLAMSLARRVGPDPAALMLLVQLSVGGLVGVAALSLLWRSLPRDLASLLRTR